MGSRRKPRTKYSANYRKKMIIALAVYIAYIFLCCCVALLAIFIPFENEDLAECIIYISSFALFLGGSAAMTFGVIPALKRAQAKDDYARHDFSPYNSSAETERFTCAVPILNYRFTPSPFDTPEISENMLFKDADELKEYLSQFRHERLVSEREYRNEDDFPPFTIGRFFGDGAADGNNVRVEKRIEDGLAVLDVYDVYTAEFSDDGIAVGEKLYPYETVEANVVTGFGHNTQYRVVVRIIVELDGNQFLLFDFCTRIAAVIGRFGIKVRNRDMFDYILADPGRAFVQTALQLGLRKLR